MALVEEELPGVGKVRSQFQEREDSVLARQLQDAEFEDHFNSNVQLRRTARTDVGVAKELQEEEVQLYREVESGRRDEMKKREEEDLKAAAEIQRKLKEEAEIEAAMKMQDELIAKKMQDDEMKRQRQKRRQEDEDRRMARQASLSEEQSEQETRRDEELSLKEARRLQQMHLSEGGGASGTGQAQKSKYTPRDATGGASSPGHSSYSPTASQQRSGQSSKYAPTAPPQSASPPSPPSPHVGVLSPPPAYNALEGFEPVPRVAGEEGEEGGGGGVMDENERIAIQEEEDEQMARKLFEEEQKRTREERRKREQRDIEIAQRMQRQESGEHLTSETQQREMDDLALARKLQREEVERQRKLKQQRLLQKQQQAQAQVMAQASRQPQESPPSFEEAGQLSATQPRAAPPQGTARQPSVTQSLGGRSSHGNARQVEPAPPKVVDFSPTHSAPASLQSTAVPPQGHPFNPTPVSSYRPGLTGVQVPRSVPPDQSTQSRGAKKRADTKKGKKK